jgi:hypothetical protein
MCSIFTPVNRLLNCSTADPPKCFAVVFSPMIAGNFQYHAYNPQNIGSF